MPYERGETRPFFVIGAGRSGTTLLRRLLITAPGVHVPPETYVLGPTVRQFQRMRHTEWPDIVHATLARFEYYPEFRHFDLHLGPLANRLLDLTPGKRSLARIFHEFFLETASDREAVVRWGDKTPHNTAWLVEIDKAFPTAQYVHLSRDPIDVVASYLRMGRYATPDEAIQRWREATLAALAFARQHPDRVHTINYEALVANPEQIAQDLTTFLELRLDGVALRSRADTSGMGDVPNLAHHESVGAPATTSSVGRGRSELAASDVAMIEAATSALLDRVRRL